MGRTSKFLFPIPGRRHASKDPDPSTPKSSSGRSTHSTTSNLSKAQRILGTESELNIDSPRSDAPSWAYPSSRSSGISISISESTRSTRSTTETGSFSGSNVDHWDHDSAAPRRVKPQLHEKASSTLLGQDYGEYNGAPTDASSISRRMRHEGSDSTLKSYYDRQKSPLAVSQQTSESSARDLALRKGHLQITRSPLLQVESSDPYEREFSDSKFKNPEVSRDNSAKKKPNRLDLSLFFPRSRHKVTAESSHANTAAEAPNGPGSRKKLSKRNSKESLKSQASNRFSQTTNKNRQTTDTLGQVYDRYGQLPIKSHAMGQIPESRVSDQRSGSSRNPKSNPPKPLSVPSRNQHESNLEERSAYDLHKLGNPNMSPGDSNNSFSWKNLRSNMPPNHPWESSSAASMSSRNTKTSRHTNTSAFSSTDLKQSSVLSLSSDSEDESDIEPIRTPASSSYERPSRDLHNDFPKPPRNHHQVPEQPLPPTPRKPTPRKGAAQAPSFLSIPEASLPNPRISGPWSPPDLSHQRESVSRHTSEKKSRRNSKKTNPLASAQSSIQATNHLESARSSMQMENLASAQSSMQPTPPLSPSSVVFRGIERNDSVSGRYMAVTKQEEQLLEALRQKRARMKESIIQEHEARSPPRIPSRTTSSRSENSVRTVRNPDGSSNKGHILLYLDTPGSHTPRNPELSNSEHSGHGSDDDFATPRSSWAPQKHPQRFDSISSKRSTLRSSAQSRGGAALRLSAVGAEDGFQQESDSKKRGVSVAVRFADEDKQSNDGGFLFDENEEDNEVVWGM